jgi:hypothetical protein
VGAAGLEEEEEEEEEEEDSLFLFKIYFNSIIPSTPRFSKWSLPKSQPSIYFPIPYEVHIYNIW